MKFMNLTLATASACLLTSAVSAATLFAYPEQSVTVNNGSLDLDLVSVDGAGTPDGVVDLTFEISEFEGQSFAFGKASPTIEPLNDEITFGTSRGLSFGVAVEFDGVDSGDIIQFSAGDVVDSSYTFTTNRFLAYDDTGLLSQGFPNLGLEEGQTSFIGLNLVQIERIVRALPVSDGPQDDIFTFEEDGVEFGCITARGFCLANRELSTQFGFLELTRGSLTPGRFGFNLTGAGAVVPGDMSAVPLPAAGWMLIAGLAGLGALRKRGS